jgi:hypothetical protein
LRVSDESRDDMSCVQQVFPERQQDVYRDDHNVGGGVQCVVVYGNEEVKMCYKGSYLSK